jgi:hypothetical protein
MKQSLLKFLCLCTALTSSVMGAATHEFSPHAEARAAPAAYMMRYSESHDPTGAHDPTVVNIFIFPGFDARSGASIDTRALRHWLDSAAAAMTREAEELRSPLVTGASHMPTKVNFPDITELAAISAKIKTDCAADGAFELDFSDKSLNAFEIADFVTMITSDEMRAYLPKITRLNFHNNLMGLRGLQYLIPLLELDTLEVVDISGNRIDSNDIKNFGTVEGDDEEMDRDERIMLSPDVREKMVKKLIWIPKSYFNPSDASINPSGPGITSEVIQRHRQHYDLVTH